MIDQDEGWDEDVHCQKGRRWMSPLLRMVFGVSGAGHSHDSSLELLPVLVCGLAHLPATIPVST